MIESEAVVGHSLCKVALPQRAAAVQRSAGDLTDDLIEFSPPAGSGHLNSPKVVVEVHGAVFQPHRMVESGRDVDQPLPQGVEQVQPPRDGPPKHVECELAVEVGGMDDRDFEGVRVQVRCLAVQQHGVHAVESLHVPTPFAADVSIEADGVRTRARVRQHGHAWPP